MPHYYLNTYAPLVTSSAGRLACQEYDIPPFVDGSIRREPDLEHEYPVISCLCRGDKFAPRLEVGDTVAYLTRKARFGTGKSQRRLTAVLQVQTVLVSHEDGSNWYRDQNLDLPSNCMVRGNEHEPLVRSHRQHVDSKKLSDEKLSRRWDGQYRVRASRYGSFVVCDVLFRDLSWEAPVVNDDKLVKAFGRIPGTQNPGSLPQGEFHLLLGLLGISVPPCAR